MKLVLKTIAAFVVLSIILNYFFKDPILTDNKNAAEFNMRTDNCGPAENYLIAMLQTDSLNIDVNYNYVKNHYSIPEYTRVGRSSRHRDDSEIIDRYDRLCSSGDSAARDIGYYCRGLCFSFGESYSKAYEMYHQVKNKNLKYLNNSLGFYFKRLGQDSAVYYLKREIALRGNMDGAVSNLADYYLSKKRVTEMAALKENAVTADYISDTQLRRFYFLQGNYLPYFENLYLRIFNIPDWYSIIACILIALVWLGYLRFNDVFEPEKWYNVGIVFAISLLLSPLGLYLYDICEIDLAFELNGNWLHDLLYCVFGIGLIEEFIKLIPLLIFLRFFKKVVDEPIDYIIYACVSALGFAFVENLIYFNNVGYQIIQGRALSAAVAHMGFSSMVAYGFVVARYKSNVKPLFLVLFALLTAALYHGFYDYWIISEAVNFLSILSIFVLLSLITIWNIIKSNALNFSPFFDTHTSIDAHKLRHYLFLGLMVVLAFEYIAISTIYGPSIGTRSLIKSLWEGTYLMIILLFNITSLKLKKQSWCELKPW